MYECAVCHVLLKMSSVYQIPTYYGVFNFIFFLQACCINIIFMVLCASFIKYNLYLSRSNSKLLLLMFKLYNVQENC